MHSSEVPQNKIWILFRSGYKQLGLCHGSLSRTSLRSVVVKLLTLQTRAHEFDP